MRTRTLSDHRSNVLVFLSLFCFFLIYANGLSVKEKKTTEKTSDKTSKKSETTKESTKSSTKGKKETKKPDLNELTQEEEAILSELRAMYNKTAVRVLSDTVTPRTGMLHFLFGDQMPKFIHNHWERSPLLVARPENPDIFQSIISSSILDFILHNAKSTTNLTRPALNQVDVSVVKRIMTDGDWWTAKWPTKAQNATLGVDEMQMPFLHGAFRNGFTLVVNKVDARWPPIRWLCGNLPSLFGVATAANLYFTPTAAQGFQPHFDVMDTIIIQIEGKKTWRVYSPPQLLLPRPDMEYKPHVRELPIDPQTITLSPGDVLYIPRGFVHEASTAPSKKKKKDQEAKASQSLHITIGLETQHLIWETLIHFWISVLAEAPADSSAGLKRVKEALAQRVPIPPRANDALSWRGVLHMIVRGVANADFNLRRTVDRELEEDFIVERLRVVGGSAFGNLNEGAMAWARHLAEGGVPDSRLKPYNDRVLIDFIRLGCEAEQKQESASEDEEEEFAIDKPPAVCSLQHVWESVRLFSYQAEQRLNHTRTDDKLGSRDKIWKYHDVQRAEVTNAIRSMSEEDVYGSAYEAWVRYKSWVNGTLESLEADNLRVLQAHDEAQRAHYERMEQQGSTMRDEL